MTRAARAIGIAAAAALIAAIAPACNRVVDLTPFYDAPPDPDGGFPQLDAALPRIDGGLDAILADVNPDGAIDANLDGNPPIDGSPGD
jgi:hypothetical protein